MPPWVLLVDDDEDLRQTLASLRQRRCADETARDGVEALQVLRETFRADLLILDLNIPPAGIAYIAPPLRRVSRSTRKGSPAPPRRG
jgi:CheY-like chemotaxis protein